MTSQKTRGPWHFTFCALTPDAPYRQRSSTIPSSRLAGYLADRLIVFLADFDIYEAEIQESPTGGESVILGE